MDDDVRGPRVILVVIGVVIAVVVVWASVAAAVKSTPEDAVEDFLSAVADKDLESAFDLVDDVPYGDAAAFLAPEAINDDWWVVSVTEVGRDYSTQATVEAVIAGPGGTAEGEFVTHEYDGEWLLVDPFVHVQFPASPLSFVQVNDLVLEPAAGTVTEGTYPLLPGLYRFYQPVPDVVDTAETELVAALPPPDSSSSLDAPVVVPAALTAGARATEQLQTSVRQRIDECVEFVTQAPYGGCPFATDGEIDTPNGKRVTELRGLTWTVGRYPVVTMADDRSEEHDPRFALRTVEPGTVTLTGSGIDTDGRATTFTVTCAIDLAGIQGTLGADGGVDLSGDPQTDGSTLDTCRPRS